MGLLHIAVVGADVQDTGDSPSEPGGESPLVECHVLYSLRLEYGKQSQQVVHIVNRYTVQQDKVLCRSAAADIQAGEALYASLYAWKQLEGLHQIGLSEQRRGIFKLQHRNIKGTWQHRL